MKVLDTKDAAKLLSLNPRTLRDMRGLGIGPAYIRMFVGRDTGNPTIGYLEKDLEEWILAQRVEAKAGIKERWLGEGGVGATLNHN